MEIAAPYTISATDRRGLIVIVETLFMSWMVIVGLIRLAMRLTINGPVQSDDLMVFVASVSLSFSLSVMIPLPKHTCSSDSYPLH